MHPHGAKKVPVLGHPSSFLLRFFLSFCLPAPVMTCRMTSHSYWWRGTVQLSWTAVQYSCILPWKAWVRAHEDGGRTASDGSWTLKLSLREKYRWCASGLRKGPKWHFIVKYSFIFISHGFHVNLYIKFTCKLCMYVRNTRHKDEDQDVISWQYARI